MTLIFSMATPHFVVQASDRCMSVCQGGKYLSVDDAANKTVLVSNQITYAASGLAHIGPERIDDYLVRIIRDHKQPSPLELGKHIAKRLTESYRRIIAPAHVKRLTVYGVGWLFPEHWSKEGGVPNVPFMQMISNHAGADRFLPEAQPTFEVGVVPLTLPQRWGKPMWAYKSHGVDLTQGERDTIDFALRKHSRRKDGTATKIGILFAGMICRVANRLASQGHHVVGKNILVTIIHRKFAGEVGESFLVTDPLNPTGAPERKPDEKSPPELVEYDNIIKPFGPAVVSPWGKVYVSKNSVQDKLNK